jgi:type I restriction enzyme S subunit
MPKLSLNASKKTKHTPAGEIPVDWGWAALGSIAKIKSGGTPSRTNATFWNGNIPWVKTGEIDKRWIASSSEMITDQGLAGCASDLFQPGTILMAMYGQGKTRGQVARLTITAAINQACAAIVAQPTQVDSNFLYSNLESRYDEIRGLSNTGNQENLNAQIIRSLPIALPPLPEQRRIADILSTWDRAIETLESLIAAKERRKQALMEQLLSGRKRLPGFTGKWSKVKLSELLTSIIRATAKPSSPFLAAGIRCHGRGVFLKPDFKPADIMLDELYEIQTNDLVVNITFAWEGAIAIVPEEANGALVSHRFPTYLFKQDLTCSEFFRHVIQTHGFVFECGLASPGGAGRNRVLSKKNFLKITIPCPELREQQVIATVLDTADRELTLHRQHLATLRTQKRGLMKLLLTGAIRTC